MERRLVQCGAHGAVPPAYVCQHLVASLRDGEARGVVWCRDDGGHVNGWCDACDDFLAGHGGEWNDQTEGFAGITLICERCFDRLRESQPARFLE